MWLGAIGEMLWHKKKTLLWIGASLRLYTDVFEDLIIFGTILYICVCYIYFMLH